MTEAAKAAATPAPLDKQPTLRTVAASPSPHEEAGDGGKGKGDGAKPSPGLSPSTWKPNAAAAEWTPTFGGPPPAAAPSPVAADAETKDTAAPGSKGEGGKGGDAEGADEKAGAGAAGGEGKQVGSSGDVFKWGVCFCACASIVGLRPGSPACLLAGSPAPLVLSNRVSPVMRVHGSGGRRVLLSFLFVIVFVCCFVCLSAFVCTSYFVEPASIVGIPC